MNFTDNQLNITSWQLFLIAEALTKAKRLEKYRNKFHKELYECISYPTTNYDKIGNPTTVSSATDAQAIRIIELKERYDTEVQKEYERDVRWRSFLSVANEKDRLIMIRYFKKKKYVKPEIVFSLLSRINAQVEEEEVRIERERNLQAQLDYMKHRKTNERKPNIKRVEYVFSNDEWKEVDPEEIARQEWKAKSKARQVELRNQLHTKGENNQ
ncbi:hypothetical protein [Planococcus soli]|uniref:hypothetical protein n=1 Tax=Planococcus soli TaxID=2666072 RepID=UPI00115CB20A|nr:hypothetical protein [Planococcus soli]